jgi:hypothetical protein
MDLFYKFSLNDKGRTFEVKSIFSAGKTAFIVRDDGIGGYIFLSALLTLEGFRTHAVRNHTFLKEFCVTNVAPVKNANGLFMVHAEALDAGKISWNFMLNLFFVEEVVNALKNPTVPRMPRKDLDDFIHCIFNATSYDQYIKDEYLTVNKELTAEGLSAVKMCPKGHSIIKL